jgi:5-oxoprolinase (ATP-hydrolysing)
VHPHGFNATPAIVTAAVLYVLRCVSGSNLPLCDGVLRDVKIKIPAGLLDPPADPDPAKCAAVVAGNVETSQRIVDVLLGALGVAAASQGTMNNLLIGDETFGYYETIGGGSGATPDQDGADAVHTHMTNTRITDPEVLESRLPVRLHRFAIRQGSGGAGNRRGGDGMIREFEFLKPLIVSLITGRRTKPPYGASSGEPGRKGRNLWTNRDGTVALPPTVTIHVSPGDRLTIETPGGGGWGSPNSA